MFTVALNRDNVIDGVFIEQTELPTKDEISEMSENEELSSLSKAAVSLAKYNKNTEKNPDNYRKYLANYLTLLTVGLEFFAIVGVAFVTVGYLISRKGKEISFIKVFASIGIAGLIETTINTFILMLCISSYAGRSFLILWVPRLCQELAVTALQAMVIALLYGAMLGATLEESTLSFSTEHEEIATYIAKLVREFFKKDPSVDFKIYVGRPKYTLTFAANPVASFLNTIEKSEDSLLTLMERSCPNCAHTLLRGAFLSFGTVSDPTNSYHAEFILPFAKRADRLDALLAEIGLPARKITRGNKIGLYYKKKPYPPTSL